MLPPCELVNDPRCELVDSRENCCIASLAFRAEALEHLKRVGIPLTVERRVRGLCLVLIWSPDDEAVLRLLPRFRNAVLELEKKIRLPPRRNGRRPNEKRCG